MTIRDLAEEHPRLEKASMPGLLNTKASTARARQAKERAADSEVRWTWRGILQGLQGDDKDFSLVT